MHTDERLDLHGEEAREHWRSIGGRDGAIELGFEGGEYELPARAPMPRTVATA
jgi:hypothetical protein